MKISISLSAFFLAGLVAFSAAARPTFGKHGAVVSASDLASQAGVKTLQKGGNAADAAVTTAFVLAVTRPYYGALGGGGFMLVKFKNQIQSLDHRERAPRASTEDMYIKSKNPKASEIGGLAVGVPGNVRGLYEMHGKFGKLSWSACILPAVELAKNGFIVGEEFARVTRENRPNFNEAGKKFFSQNGAEIQVGDRFKQPQLAAALEIIQKKGADGFYDKAIADDITKTVAHEGGILDTTDLSLYQAVWRTPLHARVLGADIYTMPPPSSGGALMLEEMKISELLKVADEKPYGTEQFHLMAEIMERAFFDRQYIADPAYTQIPVDQLYGDERAARWAATIKRNKKSGFDPKKFELTDGAAPAHEGGNTTHYVVIDRDGNVVSATTTLNGNYGSGVATEKFGIFLNNEMDDFTTRPGEPNMFGLIQGKANLVAPKKTPLSSMTPTIVEKDGKLWLALGSPGGPRIINAVYQVLFHALTTPLNLDELIQAPRVHHQFKPDKLYFDRSLSPDTQENLEKMGHTLAEGGIARVYGIRVTPDGLLEGAFDARGEGGAAGY